MERVTKGTIDHLHRLMDERFADTKFVFLLEGLCYDVVADNNDIQKKLEGLCELYRSDVDGQELYEDILDCRTLISEELLESIVHHEDESVFLNLLIDIQLMLIITVPIPSCERSFTELKRTFSYLRPKQTERKKRRN